MVASTFDIMVGMEQVDDEFSSEGRERFVNPNSSSNSLGFTGYLTCTEEILAEPFQMNLNISDVAPVVASNHLRKPDQGLSRGKITMFWTSDPV